MANFLFPHEQHSKNEKSKIIKKHDLKNSDISLDGSSAKKSTKELRKSLKTDNDATQLVKDLVEYKARTIGNKEIDSKVIKDYKSIEDSRGKASSTNLMIGLGAFGAQTGIGLGISKSLKDDVTDEQLKALAKNLNAKTNAGTKFEALDNPVKSHFDAKNNIVRGGKNKAIVAHEYGHVDAYKNKYPKMFGKAAPHMRIPAMVAPLAAIGGVSYALNEKSKGEGNKVTDFVAANPVSTAAAASVPLMADEAYASYKGLKMLKQVDPNYKVTKGLKTLLPALGTYATIPALAMGTAYVAKKHHERVKGKEENIRKSVRKYVR